MSFSGSLFLEVLHAQRAPLGVYDLTFERNPVLMHTVISKPMRPLVSLTV